MPEANACLSECLESTCRRELAGDREKLVAGYLKNKGSWFFPREIHGKFKAGVGLVWLLLAEPVTGVLTSLTHLPSDTDGLEHPKPISTCYHHCTRHLRVPVQLFSIFDMVDEQQLRWHFLLALPKSKSSFSTILFVI